MQEQTCHLTTLALSWQRMDAYRIRELAGLRGFVARQ